MVSWRVNGRVGGSEHMGGGVNETMFQVHVCDKRDTCTVGQIYAV